MQLCTTHTLKSRKKQMESCMCEPKKGKTASSRPKMLSEKKSKKPHVGRSLSGLVTVDALYTSYCQRPINIVRFSPLGKLLKLQSKYLRGRCIEMVGHLQSCYSFGATNSTFFPCPVSIKCRQTQAQVQLVKRMHVLGAHVACGSCS